MIGNKADFIIDRLNQEDTGVDWYFTNVLLRNWPLLGLVSQVLWAFDSHLNVECLLQVQNKIVCPCMYGKQD